MFLFPSSVHFLFNVRKEVKEILPQILHCVTGIHFIDVSEPIRIIAISV